MQLDRRTLLKVAGGVGAGGLGVFGAVDQLSGPDTPPKPDSLYLQITGGRWQARVTAEYADNTNSTTVSRNGGWSTRIDEENFRVPNRIAMTINKFDNAVETYARIEDPGGPTYAERRWEDPSLTPTVAVEFQSD